VRSPYGRSFFVTAYLASKGTSRTRLETQRYLVQVADPGVPAPLFQGQPRSLITATWASFAVPFLQRWSIRFCRDDVHQEQHPRGPPAGQPPPRTSAAM